MDLSGYVFTGDHASRGSAEKGGRAIGHYDMKSERRLKGVGKGGQGIWEKKLIGELTKITFECQNEA